jgi:hypothetical protein
MTHDEIMEMAEKCGFHPWKIKTPQDLLDLISFAKLVAANEREACAKVCDCIHELEALANPAEKCAAAIRARGQA